MNRTIRTIVAVATDTAFRSVEVRRVEPEPDGPVLVVANHGGGLGDILTVIAGTGRFPRFLARDIIWKVPVAKQVMDAVRAIPVSRRQDHGSSADNTGMFDAAFAGLQEGDLLAIYPEGESVDEPRLAPLRTGAARILLGAWARGVDVSIQPIGLHYMDISVLRGRCLVQVGRPVRLRELVPGLPGDHPLDDSNHEAVRALTDILAQRLGEVVDEYDDWQERREYESAAAVYLAGTRDTTSVTFGDLATTAEQIGRASAPTQREVRERLQAYVAQLELLGLKDSEVPGIAIAGVKAAGRAAGVLVLSPLALYGMVVNAPPMVGLRLISMTGVAPATAASLKPAFALLAFPVVWGALGWWGHRRAGTRGAVLMAASGPASLAATTRAAEHAQLLFRVARAYRRAKGPALQQFVNARDELRSAVRQALAEATD